MTRRSTALLLVLTLAAGGQMAFYASRLPAKVASHFDAAGHPNGWMSRDAFLIFYAALLAGVLLAFVALPVSLRLVPGGFINLPNRDYWLAPARRDQALSRVSGALAWFGCGILVLTITVMELSFRANLPGGSFNSAVAWIALAAFAVFTVAWLARLYRTFALPPSEKA